jgi:hypothetical protein
MKKLLIIITLLFSVNCYSQDTTQVQKGHFDTTIVFHIGLHSVDSLVVKDIEKRERIKRFNRRMNRICFPIFAVFTISLLIL